MFMLFLKDDIHYEYKGWYKNHDSNQIIKFPSFALRKIYFFPISCYPLNFSYILRDSSFR